VAGTAATAAAAQVPRTSAPPTTAPPRNGLIRFRRSATVSAGQSTDGTRLAVSVSIPAQVSATTVASGSPPVPGRRTGRTAVTRP
jgi:hypothetical protein